MKKLQLKFNTRLRKILGLVLLVITIVTLPHLLAAAIGIQTALVFTSALVDQGSGHFGDMVISHNRNGNYIRRHVKPIQPHTARQGFFRGMIRGYAQLWKGTTINRDAWTLAGSAIKVISKMGKVHTMTGFDLFIKYNNIAQQINPDVSLITTPPAVQTLFPLITGLACNATLGPDLLTIQPNKIGDYVAGMKMQIWASAPVSPGVNATPKLKIVGIFDPSAVAAMDITAAYEAIYGPLILGKKLFFIGRLMMPTGESDVKVGSNCIIANLPG